MLPSALASDVYGKGRNAGLSLDHHSTMGTNHNQIRHMTGGCDPPVEKAAACVEQMSSSDAEEENKVLKELVHAQQQQIQSLLAKLLVLQDRPCDVQEAPSRRHDSTSVSGQTSPALAGTADTETTASAPQSLPAQEGDDDMPAWLVEAAIDLERLHEPTQQSGWELGWSPEHSRMYYYHVELGQTQWEPPALEASLHTGLSSSDTIQDNGDSITPAAAAASTSDREALNARVDAALTSMAESEQARLAEWARAENASRKTRIEQQEKDRRQRQAAEQRAQRVWQQLDDAIRAKLREQVGWVDEWKACLALG
eukprot:3471851-Pleurochrysis_carterae.AAC.4